jgi:hypothetical protein
MTKKERQAVKSENSSAPIVQLLKVTDNQNESGNNPDESDIPGKTNTKNEGKYPKNS